MKNNRFTYQFLNNSVNLLKKFTIKLENRPVAEFWKVIENFHSFNELKKYCDEHKILLDDSDNFIIPDKVTYV